MDRLSTLAADGCRHGSNGSAPGHRSRCVLIADDEPYIVDLLAVLLEEEGFEVLRAYDGEQAWQLAERLRPDLVISDVSMPRLTGLDLVRRLRGVRALCDTPIILMSAAARSVEADGTTFIPKPFDIDRVLSLVETELAAD